MTGIFFQIPLYIFFETQHKMVIRETCALQSCAYDAEDKFHLFICLKKQRWFWHTLRNSVVQVNKMRLLPINWKPIVCLLVKDLHLFFWGLSFLPPCKCCKFFNIIFMMYMYQWGSSGGRCLFFRKFPMCPLKFHWRLRYSLAWSLYILEFCFDLWWRTRSKSSYMY